RRPSRTGGRTSRPPRSEGTKGQAKGQARPEAPQNATWAVCRGTTVRKRPARRGEIAWRGDCTVVRQTVEVRMRPGRAVFFGVLGAAAISLFTAVMRALGLPLSIEIIIGTLTGIEPGAASFT